MKSNLKDLIAAMNIKATDNPNWCPDVRRKFLEEHGWTFEEFNVLATPSAFKDESNIPNEVMYGKDN